MDPTWYIDTLNSFQGYLKFPIKSWDLLSLMDDNLVECDRIIGFGILGIWVQILIMCPGKFTQLPFYFFIKVSLIHSHIGFKYTTQCFNIHASYQTLTLSSAVHQCVVQCYSIINYILHTVLSSLWETCIVWIIVPLNLFPPPYLPQPLPFSNH